MDDLEKRAYIEASEYILTCYLPDNFDSMEEEEVFSFLEENAWLPLQGWEGADIWEHLSSIAESLLSFRNRWC